MLLSLTKNGLTSLFKEVRVFKDQYMQEKFLGELIFSRIDAGPVFALARIQENIFEESFLHLSQILEGNYFGAYTCRACIRTRANTGKYFWGIIYVLVSCQGVKDRPAKLKFSSEIDNCKRATHRTPSFRGEF